MPQVENDSLVAKLVITQAVVGEIPPVIGENSRTSQNRSSARVLNGIPMHSRNNTFLIFGNRESSSKSVPRSLMHFGTSVDVDASGSRKKKRSASPTPSPLADLKEWRVQCTVFFEHRIEFPAAARDSYYCHGISQRRNAGDKRETRIKTRKKYQ